MISDFDLLEATRVDRGVRCVGLYGENLKRLCELAGEPCPEQVEARPHCLYSVDAQDVPWLRRVWYRAEKNVNETPTPSNWMAL